MEYIFLVVVLAMIAIIKVCTDKVVNEVDTSYEKMFAIKDELKLRNCIIFISGLDQSEEPCKVCIIKSSDKYVPLRFMGTNRSNYRRNTEDIIQKLKEWEEAYGLEIISVGYVYVEIELENLPTDMRYFAQEVYRFCPNLVEQGLGQKEDLVVYIEETYRIYMWWD